MLEREEERRLAEIEARLRVEDPELHDLFAQAHAVRPSRPGPPSHRSPEDHGDHPADRVEPPTDPFDQLDPLGDLEPPRRDWVDRPPRHDADDHPGRRWGDGSDFDAEPAPAPARSVLGSVARSLAAIIAAVAITAAVTLTLGPDVGGFVSVVAFCLAGMYGYQTLRGCPGLRRARGQEQGPG